MNQTLKKDIQDLNGYSLVSYLSILGYKPVHAGQESSLYRLYLDNKELSHILVDHETNRFINIANNLRGTLVDFACVLFGITPRELCGNIMPYKIDLLMRQQASQQIQHPAFA